MRQLTTDEEKAMQQARTDLMDGVEYDRFTLTLMSATYRQAWRDALSYQDKRIETLEILRLQDKILMQAKIDRLNDFIAGKITRDELEKVIK